MCKQIPNTVAESYIKHFDDQHHDYLIDIKRDAEIARQNIRNSLKQKHRKHYGN